MDEKTSGQTTSNSNGAAERKPLTRRQLTILGALHVCADRHSKLLHKWVESRSWLDSHPAEDSESEPVTQRRAALALQLTTFDQVKSYYEAALLLAIGEARKSAIAGIPFEQLVRVADISQFTPLQEVSEWADALARVSEFCLKQREGAANLRSYPFRYPHQTAEAVENLPQPKTPAGVGKMIKRFAVQFLACDIPWRVTDHVYMPLSRKLQKCYRDHLNLNGARAGTSEALKNTMALLILLLHETPAVTFNDIDGEHLFQHHLRLIKECWKLQRYSIVITRWVRQRNKADAQEEKLKREGKWKQGWPRLGELTEPQSLALDNQSFDAAWRRGALLLSHFNGDLQTIEQFLRRFPTLDPEYPENTWPIYIEWRTFENGTTGGIDPFSEWRFRRDDEIENRIAKWCAVHRPVDARHYQRYADRLEQHLRLFSPQDISVTQASGDLRQQAHAAWEDARALSPNDAPDSLADPEITPAKLHFYLNQILKWCRGKIAALTPPAAANGAGNAKSGNPKRPETLNRETVTKTEANKRAWQYLNENDNLTARELAEKIPCALGTISGLPAWRQLKQRLKTERLANKKPTTITLTSKLEQSLSKDDGSQLAELTADQDADYEPSPLDDVSHPKVARWKGKPTRRPDPRNQRPD